MVVYFSHLDKGVFLLILIWLFIFFLSLIFQKPISKGLAKCHYWFIRKWSELGFISRSQAYMKTIGGDTGVKIYRYIVNIFAILGIAFMLYLLFYWKGG